jgi:very-short-patch-repair endonuclease
MEDTCNMFYGAEPHTFKFAKLLRNNPTHTEILFWEKVRNKSLGFKVRRQHPIGQFIVDFYIHELKLVIEIDGGIHMKKDQKKYDLFRDSEMERHQIRVIRFKNEEIEYNIEKCLTELKNRIKESEGLKS